MIINLFQLIAQQECQGKLLKNIDHHSGFLSISKNNQIIRLGQLEKYLNDCNLMATPSEILYIFKQMDRDSDQAISMKDFTAYMNCKCTSKSKDIQKLIHHELITAKLVLKQLNNFKDINIAQLFREITPKMQLNEKQLFEWLNRNSLKLKLPELNALFFYLDRNRDGVITLNDFIELFHTSQQPIVLKQNQELKLVNALYELMHINRELEEMKFNLSEMEDFNPVAAFELFDIYQQNQITRLDFELTCMDLQIKVKQQDIQLFFQRYSEDGCFLKYDGFLRAILPKIDPIMKEGKLNGKCLGYFKQVIHKILETEERIQQVKERLCQNSEFSVELAFQFMDKLKIGSITVDEFREVFELHNIQITNQEIEQLISMYNKNCDSRVTYNSFISGMFP